jgi:hypothetical protein
MFRFILDAVALVASEGWKLLPQYRFEASTGLWRHRGGLVEPPLSLGDVRYTDGTMTWPEHRRHAPETRLADHLDEARATFASPPAATDDGRPDVEGVDDDFELLRWFWLPHELTT